MLMGPFSEIRMKKTAPRGLKDEKKTAPRGFKDDNDTR